jgi:hypothetical protein
MIHFAVESPEAREGELPFKPRVELCCSSTYSRSFFTSPAMALLARRNLPGVGATFHFVVLLKMPSQPATGVMQLPAFILHESIVAICISDRDGFNPMIVVLYLLGTNHLRHHQIISLLIFIIGNDGLTMTEPSDSRILSI